VKPVLTASIEQTAPAMKKKELTAVKQPILCCQESGTGG